MNFAEVWNQCADAHANSDDAFVRALMKNQKRYARPFMSALKQIVAGGAAHPLKGREVQFWNADAAHVLSEKA